MQVADKEGKGSAWEKSAGLAKSKEYQNLKAALANVNPVVGAATGYNQASSRKTTLGQRAGYLAGPFAVKERSTKPGAEPRSIRR